VKLLVAIAVDVQTFRAGPEHLLAAQAEHLGGGRVAEDDFAFRQRDYENGVGDGVEGHLGELRGGQLGSHARSGDGLLLPCFVVRFSPVGVRTHRRLRP